MSINWVMLSREGEVVKLPGEKIYYKVRSRIGLDLATPKALPQATPFAVKSDSGLVYVTNHRVIYLPARPTEAFRSFSAPILDFEDTRVASSFFGPWSWNAVVRPTPGGGIPADVPRLELRLTFREGGHDAFQSKFETMKERLAYARSLQQETGQIIPTGEDLPRYEPPAAASAAASAASAAAAPAPATAPATAPAPAAAPAPVPSPPSAAADAKEIEALERYAQDRAGGSAPSSTSTSTSSAPADAVPPRLAPQATPDEPPPDYEEAQAQALGMRLEASERAASERQ